MNINFPEMHIPVEGLDRIVIPKMYIIKQKYDNTKIDDTAVTIRAQIENTITNKESYAGKSIGITVGSRGIPDLDIMVRTICDILKEWQAKPFLIPAMGSHGGATAKGQLEVLETYNITEETMGVPIFSSMKVVQYATLGDIPLYCDKYAYEADGIIIFNKIKPHTDFRGKHESGLAKMMAIGLAKHKSASLFHSFGFNRFLGLDFNEAVPHFITFGKNYSRRFKIRICLNKFLWRFWNSVLMPVMLIRAPCLSTEPM